MRKYAVALVCLVIGCAAGSTIPAITAQSFAPNPSAPRWEQYCEVTPSLRGEAGVNRWNESLRRSGVEGWELVSDSLHQGGPGETGHLACFKRPMAQ
jgi:hypothetical protein